MRISYAVVIVFLLLTTSSLAADQIQIFSLQHRTATDILHQVAPLLGEGERISAAENHLVLIAAPETIKAVEQMILFLDHPLRQFLVQIRWVDAPAGSSSRLGYDSRNHLSTLPDQGTTFGTSQRQSGQQLRVIEGEAVFIVTGKDIPYSSSWAAWSGSDGQGFAKTTAFQKVRSGFSALINATADQQLLVDVTPQLMTAGKGDDLNPATLTLDRLATKITTRSGEWLDLAGFLPDSSVGSQILAGSKDSLTIGRRLQLRIEEQ